MHQNAGNCIYIFQNVLGENPQTPHQNMSPPTLSKCCLRPCSEETERRSNTLSAPKETSTDSQHRQKRALTLENTDTHFKEYGYSL